MRRYVWRFGLVFSLLFVGVLGGLLAPLPSEAANTTVTFQVDSGAVATLINLPSGAASTCTVPAGYSRCYALPTGGTYTGGSPSRSYTIRGYDGQPVSNIPPRLLVTDTGGLDNLTFTTVEFEPVATTGWGSNSANCGACTPTTSTSYGESHTLKVVITHTFGLTANIKTASPATDATKYKFALRASGMFKGNPTGYAAIANATGSGDFVEFTGDGIFGSNSTTTPLLKPFPPPDHAGALPACNTANSKIHLSVNGKARIPNRDVNYCPLRRTIVGTSAPTSSFSSNPALEQVNLSDNPYPSFSCNSNGTDCRATVMVKLTGTLRGPDSWIFSSSGDVVGGSCNLVPPGPPVSTPAVPCQSKGKGKNDTTEAMQTYFDAQGAADAPIFLAEGAEATPACEGEACPNTDNGTYEGHEYRVINLSGLTWEQARAEAQALDGSSAGWDLASIRSQGEQEFIQTLLPNPSELSYTAYWIAGEQPSESEEPGGNWRWATDGFVFYNDVVTPGGYADWGSTDTGPANEPNDLGNENHVTMDNRYGWGWNDLNGAGEAHGYIAKRALLQ